LQPGGGGGGKDPADAQALVVLGGGQAVSMTSPSRLVKNDKTVSGSTSGGQDTRQGSPAGSPVPARNGMTLTKSRTTQLQQPFLALTLMNPLSPRSRDST
jgi:hypothetical protein